MNAPVNNEKLAFPELIAGRQTHLVKRVFHWINIAIVAIALLVCCYWVFSSERYVSEASIIIQNTDAPAGGGMDLSSLLGGASVAYSPMDQMLLQAHLQSVDMLKKLDAALDLRSHYSDSSNDIASRMWFKDASMEWFHRHYLNRVNIFLDTYNGVLQISTQAYSAKMAQDITAMLVSEGESYMNELSHQLARTQVQFLEGQVENAQTQMREATNDLLAFQNKKGLVSPKATVESIHAIISKLETQRTDLQTKIGALPRTLDRNHPTRRSLAHSLSVVESQIASEQAKLASTKGLPLNSLVEEEQRLELELKFKQDVYRSALVALEKGRMDAARTLKRVSVIQSPTMPEYAWQPRRIYGLCATVCLTLVILGIVHMLRSIVLDHVD